MYVLLTQVFQSVTYTIQLIALFK